MVKPNAWVVFFKDVRQGLELDYGLKTEPKKPVSKKETGAKLHHYQTQRILIYLFALRLSRINCWWNRFNGFFILNIQQLNIKNQVFVGL